MDPCTKVEDEHEENTDPELLGPASIVRTGHDVDWHWGEKQSQHTQNVLLGWGLLIGINESSRKSHYVISRKKCVRGL